MVCRNLSSKFLKLRVLYDAMRVLLRLLRREIELEVVRKYIPREA